MQRLGNDSNASRLAVFIAIVIIVLFVIQYVRRWMKRNIPDSKIRYRSQKGLEILGYLFLIFTSISFFTGHIKDFTMAIGIFSAGVAFTMQELILSIAGSIYIFLVKVYAPGDRVEINGIKGDVIDIDSIYTTMMEIGEWVSSDNYSGRIVKLSNAFVFKGPIYNYSQDFPFIWDEFDIYIHFDSDIDMAKKIITDIAKHTLIDYTEQSIEQWKGVVKKYYIEDAQVEPTIAIRLTDNWVQFNLRYIVDYKKRRITKHILSETIAKRVLQTEGKVKLASTTLEVIRIPSVDVTIDSPNR